MALSMLEVRTRRAAHLLAVLTSGLVDDDQVRVHQARAELDRIFGRPEALAQVRLVRSMLDCNGARVFTHRREAAPAGESKSPRWHLFGGP
jgi:hypothetical protein